MKVFSIEEFTARRRKRQDDDISTMLPLATRWINALDSDPDTEADASDALLASVIRVYRDTYRDEGGAGEPTGLTAFLDGIAATIDRTTNESDPTLVATLLVVAAQNAATVAAAGNDEEAILLEWVTMGDNDVRHTHREVEGDQRPPGETFRVGGEDLPYPGYPKGDPAVWINCRCTLAPVLVEQFSSVSEPDNFISELVKAMTVGIEFRDVSPEERKRDAKEGRAMPDGSYPIDNCQDLKNAIQAIGRAKDPEKVKTHIRKRKRALGCPDVELPWALSDDETEKDMPDEETALVPEATPWHGVLAPEDTWSGDGRRFAAESLTFRDLPLPLTWQKTTDEGHDGSVVVAKIEAISRVDGEMRAVGSFLFSPEADEVVGMIAEFGRFGVSVDADDGEFEIDEESSKITFTSARICSASIVSIPAFSEAFVALGPAPEDWMGDEAEKVDVCDPDSADYDPDACAAKQAAAGKVAVFAPPGKRGPGWITDPVATKRIHDYWTRPGEEGYIKIGWGKGGDFNRCRVLVGEKIAENSPEDLRFLNNICAQWHKDALGYYPGAHTTLDVEALATATGLDQSVIHAEMARGVNLVASAAEKRAPADWFTNPNLTEPTHLTVTEEGRVFGHIAEWTSCHIGYDGVCVSPPRSTTDYAYFANKSVLLDNDEMARTGVICLGGKHAGLRLRAAAATQHYDDTTKAIADVAVGEDDYGIWCAGWVRPGTDPDLVVALRASDVSGDWRDIAGAPEMVAALACNVGGFATPAAHVAAGATLALVAAGVVHNEADPLDEIADRIISRMEQREIEKKERAEKIMALRGRFAEGEGA